MWKRVWLGLLVAALRSKHDRNGFLKLPERAGGVSGEAEND